MKKFLFALLFCILFGANVYAAEVKTLSGEFNHPIEGEVYSFENANGDYGLFSYAENYLYFDYFSKDDEYKDTRKVFVKEAVASEYNIIGYAFLNDCHYVLYGRKTEAFTAEKSQVVYRLVKYSDSFKNSISDIDFAEKGVIELTNDKLDIYETGGRSKNALDCYSYEGVYNSSTGIITPNYYIFINDIVSRKTFDYKFGFTQIVDEQTFSKCNTFDSNRARLEWEDLSKKKEEQTQYLEADITGGTYMFSLKDKNAADYYSDYKNWAYKLTDSVAMNVVQSKVYMYKNSANYSYPIKAYVVDREEKAISDNCVGKVEDNYDDGCKYRFYVEKLGINNKNEAVVTEKIIIDKGTEIKGIEGIDAVIIYGADETDKVYIYDESSRSEYTLLGTAKNIVAAKQYNGGVIWQTADGTVTRAWINDKKQLKSEPVTNLDMTGGTAEISNQNEFINIKITPDKKTYEIYSYKLR